MRSRSKIPRVKEKRDEVRVPRYSPQPIRAGDPERNASQINEELRRIEMTIGGIVAAIPPAATEQPLAPVPAPPVVVTEETGGGGGGNDDTDIFIPPTETDTLRQMSGVIWINRLPRLPAEGLEWWQTEGIEHTPQNGYYGYYVHTVIEHNWGLDNKDNYHLELVDLRKNFAEDIGFESGDPSQIGAIINHIYQTFGPRSEGIDKNRILVRGTYKPRDKQLRHHISGELLTNLVFHYTLTEKRGSDLARATRPYYGWKIPDAGGTLWKLLVRTDGALVTILDQTTNYAAIDDLILIDETEQLWKVSVTFGGVLTTTTIDTGSPRIVYIADEIGVYWRLSIDSSGALITIQE